MGEDSLNDLKQFIVATVSQATANMATKDDIADLKGDIAKLEQKIDDVDLKLDTIEGTLNSQLNDQETRITKLKQQAA